MIFWRGKGWLVPLVMFFSGVLVQLIGENLSGNPRFYQENAWPILIAFLLPAPFFWIWGNKINEGLSGNRTFTDNETGEMVDVKLKQHSFMFIPIQYWSFFTILLGVAFFLHKL